MTLKIKIGVPELSVALFTNASMAGDLSPGEYVATAKLLPYVVTPDAVLWGGRLFLRHEGAEAVYVEGFCAIPMRVELEPPVEPKIVKVEIRDAAEDPLEAVRQKAFEKGRRARRAGKDVTDDNPYFKGTVEFAAFIDGWNKEDEILL